MSGAAHSRLGMAAVGAQRAELWDAGYRPLAVYGHDLLRIPAGDRGKRPVGNDWQLRARRDPPEAAETSPDPDALNTGILCDGLRALDLDVDDVTAVHRLKALALSMLGDAPIRYRDNSPRSLLVYAAADGEPVKRVLVGKLGKVEVLGRGQQFVGFGFHPSGAVLRWQPYAPTTFTREALPEVTEAQVSAFLVAAAEIIGAEEKAIGQAGGSLFPHTPSAHGQSAAGLDVAGALAVLPNDAPPNWEEWNRVGLATWAATKGSLSGFAAWAGWSEQNPSHDPALCQERWSHYSSSPPSQIGAGTLFHLARQARPGWVKPTEANARPQSPAPLEKKARRKDQPVPDDVVGPLIRVVAGKLHVTATEAEAAIVGAGLPIYQRGSTIVRPVVQEIPAARGRTTVTAALLEMGVHGLIDALCGCATWEKFDGRAGEWVRVNPPKQVAEVLLSRIGMWALPKIAGVITTPTLRPDGSVLSASGYDRVTRLYHAADVGMKLTPAVQTPTRADADDALGLLSSLLVEFPFTSEISRAVALSGLITPVVRGAASVVPLHVFRANAPGSGKSYLADIASAIATRRPCPVASAGQTEEEFEKRLTGLLLGGYPLVSLDNVNAELGGDLLCQAIERPLIRVRRLGGSDIIEIESSATIFATGNGLRVRGDMTRRTLISDLDAGMERPELREFTFDPVAAVMQNRGAYVSACLVIVRAYILAGCPNTRPAIASFEDWSRLVRSALVWLGCADPCDSMEQAREDDPELTELREVVTVWRACPDLTGGQTVKQLADAAEERTRTTIGEPTEYANPEWRDCLQRLFGERGTLNTRRMGKWLMAREGRIVDGHRIRRHTQEAHSGVIRWTVERV